MAMASLKCFEMESARKFKDSNLYQKLDRNSPLDLLGELTGNKE